MKKPRKQPNRTATRRTVPPLQTALASLAEPYADATYPTLPAVYRLRPLAALRGLVNRAIDLAIVDAREEGASWSTIGGLLGVSAQAAQQRHSVLNRA